MRQNHREALRASSTLSSSLAISPVQPEIHCYLLQPLDASASQGNKITEMWAWKGCSGHSRVLKHVYTHRPSLVVGSSASKSFIEGDQKILVSALLM